MSRVDLFNGVTFEVESSGASFHSFDDWGLYIANTDYIKEPKQNTNYVEVPGRDGLLDLSEAVSGRPTYSGREIKISLAGVNDKTDWDSIISSFRNNINGRICKIIFDNDPTYFWRGRIDIKDFKSVLNLGTFNVDVPNAEPYKYSTTSSAEPWLWDPFNFNTDVITYIGSITVAGTESISIPKGHMLVMPDIVASNIVGTLTVTCDGNTYTLTSGTNKIPAIMVGGESDVTLTFNGNAEVQIVYRSGSL